MEIRDFYKIQFINTISVKFVSENPLLNELTFILYIFTYFVTKTYFDTYTYFYT